MAKKSRFGRFGPAATLPSALYTPLAPIRTKSHQIAAKKFCAWQKRASADKTAPAFAIHFDD
jgi:hypothetical protein